MTIEGSLQYAARIFQMYLHITCPSKMNLEQALTLLPFCSPWLTLLEILLSHFNEAAGNPQHITNPSHRSHKSCALVYHINPTNIK